ncbi:hypothetical protein [Protaetiibacter mangrovi]|uniref:Integral membrane protein n=1 Tax=Protaetiibacter mangrovi TaxID=2970926 RepID=A0ABT1ZGQ1_9MICO|nr:hypothetical protein [Protaetiibacter mangrovi]MCS0499893.1 hypothetical protein [Protaetiibacter mangrovi]TPX03554.1 hypothetical protein FJ656_16560 [Schumannella luteola]
MTDIPDVSADGSTLHEREERAAHLKERIYVTFAALAIIMGMLDHHLEPGQAMRTLGVTILGLLVAVFVADVISLVVVHERPLTRREWRVALRTSFGAVGSLALPFVFLGLAALGVWSTDAALRASEIALIAALAGIGWIAIRKLQLRWWQRLFAITAEAAVGAAVVGLQVLAHG